MNKRINKHDVILLAVIAIICMILFSIYWFGNGAKGNCVVITIDGEEYGIYSLDDNQTIDIKIDNKVTNVLEIKDGRAKMIEADCPDRLCVHQKEISKDKETIVCLPNKIVVTVHNNEESDIDAVAN